MLLIDCVYDSRGLLYIGAIHVIHSAQLKQESKDIAVTGTRTWEVEVRVSGVDHKVLVV